MTAASTTSTEQPTLDAPKAAHPDFSIPFAEVGLSPNEVIEALWETVGGLLATTQNQEARIAALEAKVPR